LTVIRDELLVLPNPAAGLARLRFGKSLDSGGRLSLYDVTGRQMLVEQVRKEAVSTELGLTGLKPGLYFIRVETKAGVLSSKLVKQ